ncbi:2OG-Fe(II) oxygenase [Thalassotalea sp. M1531]|uniref:2OG-Fe(II) oxygenase n=1 Tax=Thalassotalea algicola TaxID=2716224 RepID=A0A7Y0LA05_9GAMM|nr:2OG-Fe(II) oxygenase [Thalassotalea algicola]NMP30404.1 2OG-Fe(II) oxygenase [Thalassotalea algicola]
MQHFIVEFKQAINKDFCQYLIDKFEQDKRATQGRIGSGVDTTKKNSLDLHISQLSEWQEDVEKVNQILLQALTQYIKAYPHLLVGALAPQFADKSSGELRSLTAQDVTTLLEPQLANIIQSIFSFDAINLQKYQQGEGNFGHWHSEHYPHPSDPEQKSLHRVLLWLIYLNDVEEGGQTEFLYQQASIQPTTGSIVLSPCGFTHTHRGTTPISNDKYVLASWISYKPASELYK